MRVSPSTCRPRSTTNLTGETVALGEQADDLITISYSHLALGEFDPLLHRFTPRVRWLD